jgi:chaperonin cofactor prefoldin
MNTTTSVLSDDKLVTETSQKDAIISELKETVDILELKVKKLEQLVRLKDSRIQTLTARLQQSGVNVPTSASEQ